MPVSLQVEASGAVICHTCIKMFKEKNNKTPTKADSALISYNSVSKIELDIQMTKLFMFV